MLRVLNFSQRANKSLAGNWQDKMSGLEWLLWLMYGKGIGEGKKQNKTGKDDDLWELQYFRNTFLMHICATSHSSGMKLNLANWVLTSICFAYIIDIF